MLTNKQCIEIAEKVWGWKQDLASKPSEPSLTVWEKPHTQFAAWEHDIQTEVNSWSGFGRTLERYFDITGKKPALLLVKALFSGMDDGDEDRPDLITATHLAALEALNENTNIS